MVKPGYKQTEIGAIPEDWIVRRLSECTKRVGVGLATSVTQHYREDGIPIFRNLNIKPGYLDDSDILYLDPDFANRQESKKIRTGDVLTVHTGYVGISCVVPAKYNNALTFTTLITTTDDTLLLPEFLSIYLNSSFGALEIESLQAGGGRNNLNVNDFVNFRIPLPTISEQHKIIEYIKEIERYLDLTSQQLAKKKAIKQGAMQELLTGKKRLPGFSGEWQTIPLINALTVGHGMSQHNVESPTGKYPILATGGEIGKATTYLWAKPSVLIGRKGTINKPQYMDRPFWSIDTLFYTRIKEGYYPKFLYYVFCQIDWLNYNEASGVPSLSAKTIESIEVQVPEYAEQIAIADLLSEMDSEIELLEQKLAKYRQLKQGMMQQLLTGKIRLTK